MKLNAMKHSPIHVGGGYNSLDNNGLKLPKGGF